MTNCTGLSLDVPGLCWALLDCTLLYWALLGYSEVYWAILGCTWLHWAVLGWTGLYGVMHILRNHFWGSREPPPLCNIVIIWAYPPLCNTVIIWPYPFLCKVVIILTYLPEMTFYQLKKICFFVKSLEIIFLM